MNKTPETKQTVVGHIHLRVPMERKSAYVRAAKPGKLVDWIIRALDDRAKICPNCGRQVHPGDCTP